MKIKKYGEIVISKKGIIVQNFEVEGGSHGGFYRHALWFALRRILKEMFWEGWK